MMVGVILGSILAASATLVIVAGVAGVLALAAFNRIVQGEVPFSGRGISLYLLPLLIAASLSFLGAKFSEGVRRSHTESRTKDHR